MTKPNRGICGPHSIGIITGILRQTVMLDWDKAGLGPYKGYAPFKEIKAMLDFYGIKYKQVGAGQSKQFDLKSYRAAIVRIQWDGDWGHWAEAQMHTHYVALTRHFGKYIVDCDGWGRFEANSNEYLTDEEQGGTITSYLYIL